MCIKVIFIYDSENKNMTTNVVYFEILMKLWIYKCSSKKLDTFVCIQYRFTLKFIEEEVGIAFGIDFMHIIGIKCTTFFQNIHNTNLNIS